MQFYTMETRNEICNYKRIHRLYPHFATPYRYHPSFTFAYEISTVMRVDANETHRVHTEKKAFSFDFIKTR